MNTATKTDATQILKEWNEGDKDAPARLMPLVYEELRRLGAAYLRNERPDHTLGATALVHEAYLKLVDQNAVSWENSIHFRAVAARAMRQVLVEHARARNAEKRGGKLQKIYLDETKELSQEQGPGSGGARRGLAKFCQHLSAGERGGRAKIFRWTERKRDRGGAGCFYQNCISRLDVREALALQ